jgi:adenylate cyclase
MGEDGAMVRPTSDGTHAAVPDVHRRLAHAIELRLLVANAIGAVFVFGYLKLTLDAGPPPRHPDGSIDVFVFLGYLLLAGVLGFVWGNRMGDAVCDWDPSVRPPTPEERRAVLTMPFRQGVVAPLVFWAIAAVGFALCATFYNGTSVLHAVHIADGVLLGGVTTCALGYLLVEGTYRELTALALAGESPKRPTSLGIRSRLLLSWALGSAVPLGGIVSVRLGNQGTDPHRLLLAATVLALAGLAVGLTMTLAVARSVAGPLAEVRDALRRVRDGDLDVTVPVDDGGEVGLLQSGVNRMVAGLRERQQLQDLFGRHVGEEVARHALEEGGAVLGGVQREVSTLFVDIVGSTAMTQTLPPDEVVATLNAFFGAVVRVVGAEGGWVNKFEGDGALCVFGAPTDQPDGAARALRAARVLRGELEALSLLRPGLDAGIGVSSGLAVAGNVGAEERYEYTVIGDPVNEASRLSDEAKNRPGRVLCSEAAVRVAGDEADHWQPAGSLALRGRSGRTVVFEPAAAQGAEARALQARSTPSSSTS